MNIVDIANSIQSYFLSLTKVNDCRIYGSIAKNCYDKYSDIDIEVDVSGYDNSSFSLEIPDIISKIYPVLYFDYAPSLMPQSYIVSNAISAENPFLIVDVKCVATPHIMTLGRSSFPFDHYDHTLKVFVANLKHFLRGVDCVDDIVRMHSRVCGTSSQFEPDTMMKQVFSWLMDNANECHFSYLINLRNFIHF